MILNKNTKALLLFFIFINFFEILSASIENKIILKVENEIITNYEIKNKILISLMLAGDEVNQKNINNLKKQAVESLIQLKLKKIELDKYDIKKNDTKINAYLNSISSNNIVDLKNQFINKNLDYQTFLNEIEVQFKWQDLIYQIYSKKINIDEKSLNQEIKNYVSNNSEVIEYKISEIEIFLNNNELDKKKIFELEKRIEEEGFENSALKYSESPSSNNRGNLGWVNSKSLNEEIYNILKKMNKNEISKPINRQNSILYLKLNDIRSSKTNDVDLEKLKNNLITQKTNELFNLYSRSHLSKLRNTSLIEYK